MSPTLSFRPITPKPLAYAQMRAELLKGLSETGRSMRGNFLRTVATWRRKADFDQFRAETPLIRNNVASVEASTEDERYKWLNFGTQAHVIVPVNAKALSYFDTFRSKTTPRVIGSRAGFVGGTRVFRPEGVMHPGIEPREFDFVIADRTKSVFKNAITRAMHRARTASGHRFP